MADLIPKERLQPCLLDRLSDDEPGTREESRSHRVVSAQTYRRGVLRDIEWLLNTNAMLALEGMRGLDLAKYPEACESVLNFGTRQFCGMTAPNLQDLSDRLEEAVRVFEPRIAPRSLTVHTDKERNVIVLEVEGELWANPVSEHLHLRTGLDLETGQLLGEDALPKKAEDAHG
jgi:type VI secretion system protein ImpF